MGLKEDLWRMIFGRRRLDDGTIVRRKGRDVHEVQIGKRAARVYTELQMGPIDFVVASSSIREWTSGEGVSESDRAEIVRQLTRYFERNRYRYQIE